MSFSQPQILAIVSALKLESLNVPPRHISKKLLAAGIKDVDEALSFGRMKLQAPCPEAPESPPQLVDATPSTSASSSTCTSDSEDTEVPTPPPRPEEALQGRSRRETERARNLNALQVARKRDEEEAHREMETRLQEQEEEKKKREEEAAELEERDWRQRAALEAAAQVEAEVRAAREDAREQAPAKTQQVFPTCSVCAAPITKSYVEVGESEGEEEKAICHPECLRKHRESTADSCLHCSAPVLGKFYGTPDGVVHFDCYEEWREASAPKCAVCSGSVLGQAYDTDKGRVHKACFERFRAATADPCLECGGPLTQIEGQFSGKFRSVESEGGVHEECYGRFRERTADKCAQCGGAVLGQFYDLGEEGKVHGGCIEEWNKRAS
jgi:hypothetical protein